MQKQVDLPGNVSRRVTQLLLFWLIQNEPPALTTKQTRSSMNRLMRDNLHVNPPFHQTHHSEIPEIVFKNMLLLIAIKPDDLSGEFMNHTSGAFIDMIMLE